MPIYYTKFALVQDRCTMYIVQVMCTQYRDEHVVYMLMQDDFSIILFCIQNSNDYADVLNTKAV